MVTTRIAPSSLAKLKADALRYGFKTERAYLEALIEAGLPDDAAGVPERFESVVPAQLPTLLGHRAVVALQAVTDRLDADEALEPIAEDLRAIRKDVTALLLRLHAGYDREIDAREARLPL